MDSDRSNTHDVINPTKERLKEEFDKGPGYAWITAGREIENYFSGEQLTEAIEKTKPSSKAVSKFGEYDSCLSIILKNDKKSTASKVGVANYIVNKFSTDMSILDLEKQIKRLFSFITESNPGVA
jgi:hypothetical protein